MQQIEIIGVVGHDNPAIVRGGQQEQVVLGALEAELTSRSGSVSQASQTQSDVEGDIVIEEEVRHCRYALFSTMRASSCFLWSR